MALKSKEEVDGGSEAELEGASWQISEVKKGERVKKAAAALYDEYAAAGGVQER